MAVLWSSHDLKSSTESLNAADIPGTYLSYLGTRLRNWAMPFSSAQCLRTLVQMPCECSRAHSCHRRSCEGLCHLPWALPLHSSLMPTLCVRQSCTAQHSSSSAMPCSAVRHSIMYNTSAGKIWRAYTHTDICCIFDAQCRACISFKSALTPARLMEEIPSWPRMCSVDHALGSVAVLWSCRQRGA